MDLVVLQCENALVGRDVSRVLEQFRNADNVVAGAKLSRFKKKEALESMAKSIIKHRIQTLTGRNMNELEHALGFSIKDGTTMSVQQCRHLAHLFILEANAQMTQQVNNITQEPPTSRKRKVVPENDTEVEVKRVKSARKSLAPTTSSFKAKTTRSRKSLAPEMLSDFHTVAEPVVEEEEEVEDEDDDLGLVNPTPQMKELRRKSLAKLGSPMKNVPKVRQARGRVAPVEKLAPPPKMVKQVKAPPPIKTKPAKVGFPGASFFSKDGEDEDTSLIYLVQADPTKLQLDVLRKVDPNFSGANLTVLHTPADWDALRVFNMALQIKNMNKSAKLDTFLLLVGCDLTNVHTYRDALKTQTAHVQFIVFERKDLNKETKANFGKLKETTSIFLLAYFFPGSDDENATPPVKLVKDGSTTCFQTENVEDLENNIITALSDEGDWVLDLCCKRRELSLAAQKCGRFALAIEPERSHLEKLREKAWAIASVHDKKFTKKDGIIVNVEM